MVKTKKTPRSANSLVPKPSGSVVGASSKKTSPKSNKTAELRGKRLQYCVAS